MLGAGQRIRRREEFSVALRAGRRARRGDLVLYLGSASDGAEPGAEHRSSARAGFIVPRAVGTAVIRNKVRRRLRHLLRDRLASLPDDGLLAVRVLPGAATQSFTGLGRDLDAALSAIARRAEVPR